MSSCRAQSSDTASIANNLKLLPSDAAATAVAGRATASEVSAPVEPAADCHAMRPARCLRQCKGTLAQAAARALEHHRASAAPCPGPEIAAEHDWKPRSLRRIVGP